MILEIIEQNRPAILQIVEAAKSSQTEVKAVNAPAFIEIVESNKQKATIEIHYSIPSSSGGGPSPVSGYTHTQSAESLSWIVNHNLGYYPSVSVFSIGGLEVEAEIVHNSINQLTIFFVVPYRGTARCL